MMNDTFMKEKPVLPLIHYVKLYIMNRTTILPQGSIDSLQICTSHTYQ